MRAVRVGTNRYSVLLIHKSVDCRNYFAVRHIISVIQYRYFFCDGVQ